MAPNTHTNYILYLTPSSTSPRIGHLNISTSTITPLCYQSGTWISSLYEVIEIGEVGIRVSEEEEEVRVGDVRILPPLGGRDVLCVGKNYREHAREFNESGFDSSDKVDIPSHPVIFTKRATSIVGTGEEILLHGEFSKSVDYEGEIGVIVGKGGFRIKEEEAWDYVWGFTIINDVTARERQRDHKQFYIGKSPDTFCPMGPIAVPAHALPKVLRVQTSVNGKERQNATTEDLIFSIPFLIKTLSEGQTLQPGDVLATGTPAGVGIGKTPPVFLKAGDEIEISVTGLSTLKNKVAEPNAANQTIARVTQESRAHIPTSNLSKTVGGTGLTSVNSKLLYYKNIGNLSGPPIVFIHGLGGSSESFQPLISTLKLAETYSLHLIDLEGFGLSPTSADSVVSRESYALDVIELMSLANITSGATVIGHSMGAGIAITMAIKAPSLISKLVLLGPGPSPPPEATRKAFAERATTVRKGGMISLVDSMVAFATSERTKSRNPIAVAAIRCIMMGQDPEGYAKGCTAIAGDSGDIYLGKVKADTLIITGDEDRPSSPETCKKYLEGIEGSKLVILGGVGHWHLFEDIQGVSGAVKEFLLG